MSVHRIGLLLFLCAAILPGPGVAEDLPAPRLDLPLRCAMGTVCQIQNYFDHDPGPGFHDYNCGVLGYDGHKGTDFRLPNLAMMRQGVAVVAAAAGEVRAVRDGMPDVSIREAGQSEAIREKEAGNSVAIVHGGGWETQYSHLLRGSILVRPGQRVQAGQKIGLVGLSGNTEFPHVHLSVRFEGRAVDPFRGPDEPPGCGLGETPLWTDQALAQLPYRGTGLLQAGFATGKPDLRQVEEGGYDLSRLSREAPALVFWVELFGARKGDRESIRILDPDGAVLARKQEVIAGNRARRFSYSGRRRGRDQWPEGVYRASYRLQRRVDGEDRDVLVVKRSIRVR